MQLLFIRLILIILASTSGLMSPRNGVTRIDASMPHFSARWKTSLSCIARLSIGF